MSGRHLPKGLDHRRRTITEVIAAGLGDEHPVGEEPDVEPAEIPPPRNRAERRARTARHNPERGNQT